MSISGKDNNIKIWNVNNWKCILNLTNINNKGYLDSACFLKSNNQIYIITSNYNLIGFSDPIKIYDFKGQKIKEVKDSNEKTFFIDTFCDNKDYIITGNNNFSRSYDINNPKSDSMIYHTYNDNKYNYIIFSIIIKNIEGIIKLIESCTDGIIRIFNFHSGLLLNTIQICDKYKLYGICLWNDNSLFIGCEDKEIKIVEIKNGLIVKSLSSHKDKVITIKKIFHNKYGECLISQNFNQSEIKLWINSI